MFARKKKTLSCTYVSSLYQIVILLSKTEGKQQEKYDMETQTVFCSFVFGSCETADCVSVQNRRSPSAASSRVAALV